MLLLTRQPFIGRLTSILVAPVTTAVRNIPTEIELTTDDGMPRRCAVNFDNLLTLRYDLLIERIGSLGPDRMGEVCRAYRFAAGC